MRKWLKILGIAAGLSLLHWGLNSLIATMLGERSFIEQFFMPDINDAWMRAPVVTLSVPMVYLVSKILELQYEVKIFEGLIPICTCCKKKIRDENGEWQDVDHYLSERGEVDFTHGICPECSTKLV